MDVVTLGQARAQGDRRYSRRQLVPMATNCAHSFQAGNALSDGVLCGGTARMGHVAIATAYGLRLVFANFYAAGGAGYYTETPIPNPITVKAAVEYPDTYLFPVTFNGADSAEIAPGGIVISDPVGLEFVKGTTFYTRTWVGVNPGEYFPRGGYGTSGSGGPTWHNYANPAGLDLTRTGSGVAASGYNEYTFGPAAILAHPGSTNGILPVVGIVGDSIAAGTGDSQRGWPQRWLDGNYAHVKVAHPGEGVGTGWGANQGLSRFRRMALMDLAGVSHVIAEYIVNDLGTTYATLLANQITYWKQVANFGRVWATTATPQTSSTDSWATTTNQTVLDSAKETKRLDYNAWLRDGAPIVAGVAVAVGTNPAVRAGETGHPLAGYLEVADLCESARNSGKWRVDLGAPTTDGTHPAAVIAQAVAAGLYAPTHYFGAHAV